MSDLMKELDKLHRMKVVKSQLPNSVLGVTLKESRRGPLVNFEQVKTVIGQWIVDNESEVDRLREALSHIRDRDWVENALDPQWAANVAKEALTPRPT